MFSSLAATEKVVNQDLVVIMAVGAEMLDDLIIIRLVVLVHHTVQLHRLVTAVTEQEETS